MSITEEIEMEYFERNAATEESDSKASSWIMSDPALLKDLSDGQGNAWRDTKEDGFPSLVEFSDPFDDAMKDKMAIDKFLAKSLQDGNLDAIQNMIELADTGREMRMLQYALKSVDVDNKGLELRLKAAQDGKPLVEIESITINEGMGCGGKRSSYTLSVTGDSASAVYNSGAGIVSTHNKPVPVEEAMADIQKKINKTLPR